MNTSTSQTDIPSPLRILIENYLNVQGHPTSFSAGRLAGDGSDRTYYRIFIHDHHQHLIAVEALHGWERCRQVNGARVTENHSFMYVAQHLSSLGFPVPQILFSSLDCRYYLLEDFGDTTLYRLIKSTSWNEEMYRYYHQALDLLIDMQLKAGITFNPSWCYAGGHYDRQLVISRELEYFLRSFAIPTGNITLPKKEQKRLSQEFTQLADLALDGPCNYLLYRDYQSKNLMLKDGKLRLVDFQGSRLGPPYYDLVSLINDPYVNLPFSTRNELFDYYYAHAAGPLSLPPRRRFDSFLALFSLIRCMQVLGAFGFLSVQKQRLHFRTYIPRALNDLKHFAGNSRIATAIPTLRQLIQQLSFSG